MYKCSISLENFRNFEFFDVEIPESDGVVIRGENGSGKTSLLESIFYLFYGVSFRDKDVNSLINYNSTYFKIIMKIGEDLFSAYLDRRGNKKVVFNDKEVTRGSIRQHFVPIYSTGKDNLLDGAYSDRRRILDKLASLYIDGYRKVLSAYEKIVKHKKQALLTKDLRLLNALNEKLYDTYIKIREGRLKVVRQLSFIAKSLGYENLHFNFVPSLESFCELESISRVEMEEGHLLKGASHDILEVTLDDKDLRKFYSHGEKQYMWFLLLFEFLRLYSADKARGVIMLMDEAFSVLDDSRTEGLLKHVLQRKANVFYFFTTQRKIQVDLPFIELGPEYGRVKTND